MGIAEHFILAFTVGFPAWTLPHMFISNARWRLVKVLLAAALVGLWSAFVLAVAIEGIPLWRSRSSTYHTEAYILALYMPLAIVLGVSGIVRAWRLASIRRDFEEEMAEAILSTDLTGKNRPAAIEAAQRKASSRLSSGFSLNPFKS